MRTAYTGRSVKLAVGALLVGTMATTSAVILSAQGKNKPQTSPGMALGVTFRDVPTDRVGSDGAGEYVHGESKVEALVYAASGDLRLDLLFSSRFMAVHLGEPLSVAPGVSAPANVSYASQAVLYVESAASVPVGEAQLRRGRLGLSPSLPGHALGFRYQTQTGEIIGGTEVCVYRASPGVWEVSSSDSRCLQADTDVAGLFEDVAKGNRASHQAVATYDVPFAITATCRANCPQ